MFGLTSCHPHLERGDISRLPHVSRTLRGVYGADMANSPFILSQRSHRSVEQPISSLMKLALDRPGLISLAAGFVDQLSLPCAVVSRLTADLLADPQQGPAALQYGTTLGHAPLRQGWLDRMADLDDVSPQALGHVDHTIATNGSQQMLHLLAETLLDPRDVIVTASPSYFVFTSALRGTGSVVRSVDTDDQGLEPESLDRLLAGYDAVGQLKRVKIVYLVTYHDNPTGRTMSWDRKRAVLDVVKRWSDRRGSAILLLEDAAYRELTYEGTAPPTLRSIPQGRDLVALCGTFSKPFAPGLKVGCSVLPEALVAPALVHKGGEDFGTSNLAQHLLANALSTGDYARHVEILKRVYNAKRLAMLTALDQCFADVPGVSWTRPTGGLYVWLTLPESIDSSPAGPLFERALELGVLFVPGVHCYPPDPTRPAATHTIRLSFGVADEVRIAEGIRRLAAAVQHAMKSRA